MDPEQKPNSKEELDKSETPAAEIPEDNPKNNGGEKSDSSKNDDPPPPPPVHDTGKDVKNADKHAKFEPTHTEKHPQPVPVHHPEMLKGPEPHTLPAHPEMLKVPENPVFTLLAPQHQHHSQATKTATSSSTSFVDDSNNTEDHHHRHHKRSGSANSVGLLLLGEKRGTGTDSQTKEIAEDIEMLTAVMAEDKKSATLSPSWEGFMALEIGIDPEIAQKHGKHMQAKKIKIDKKLMKDLQAAHPGDEKRQMAFIEEVLAAYHMKELTNRYGSGAKGKSEKQFFMEAYDAELRIEQEESGGTIFTKKFDFEGREIEQRPKRFGDGGGEALEKLDPRNPVENTMQRVCGPIVFSSVEAMQDDSTQNRAPSFMESSEINNFWGPLERLEKGLSADTFPTCSGSSASIQSWAEDQDAYGEEDGDEEPEDFPRHAFDFEDSAVEEALLDKFIERTQEQEVIQSDAVRRVWSRVLEHLKQFGLQDPLAYDMYGKIYEEVRDFVKLPEEDVQEFRAGKWDPVPMNEKEIYSLEPPEKLFGRFAVYQKALMYLAEHFETMRPLLAEIKQAYEDVLEKCEKEWKDLDEDRLENMRIKEAYDSHVRQKNDEGDRTIMQIKIQSHTLQEHWKCQQDTVHTILDVLRKVRQSLKIQKKLVDKKTEFYNTKAESLDSEIVPQVVVETTAYEIMLPEKFMSTLEHFKDITDPIEIRRVLQAARRQLRKCHKRIVIFEADYADSVPRAQFELYKKKHSMIQGENQKVIDKSNALKAEIEKIKESILEKKKQLFAEFGFDIETPPEVSEVEETETDSLFNDEYGEGEENEGDDENAYEGFF